jgi:hypothetical protein
VKRVCEACAGLASVWRNSVVMLVWLFASCIRTCVQLRIHQLKRSGVKMEQDDMDEGRGTSNWHCRFLDEDGLNIMDDLIKVRPQLCTSWLGLAVGPCSLVGCVSLT